MASNPPFHVEDQTDEDFFDKLVEDDMEPVKSGHDEGNDFDDAKAFANLSISDVDATVFENSDTGESGIELKGELGTVKSDVGLVAGHEQEGDSLLSSSSVGCDGERDLGNNGMESESTPASAVSKSDKTSSSEVKEVDWNSFYADSNGGTGFGSYSDFFSELGDQSGNFPGNAYDNLNSEVNPGNEVRNDGLTTSVNYVQYQEGQGYDASLENHTSRLGDDLNTSVNYVQYQEGQTYDASSEKHENGQDLSSSQYWEDLYPGWKYDHNTGKWYQIDGYNETAATQLSSEANTAVDWTAASGGKTEISYLQQTTQSVTGTLAETGTTESVSSWSQVSQGNNGYPEHMVFDHQYPGWYYDTIAQKWESLETYNSTIQSSVHGLENGHASTGTVSPNENMYSEYSQAGNYGTQGVVNQAVDGSWSGSYGVNHQQGFDMYTIETATQRGDNITSGGNQQINHSYGSSISVNKDQQSTYRSFGSVALYNKVNHDHGLANGTVESQSFVPAGNTVHQFNYSNTKFDDQQNFSNDFAENQKSFSYSQQSIQGGHQYSYASHVGSSSAGRPPHALVTFGFGGKLIIMKDPSLLSSSYGSQDSVQGSVSVLNLMEVVKGSTDSSSIGNGTGDYFRALCQQSFPGPLVGGNVGNKELYKWLDERIACCESHDMDYKKGERLRLLLSLLKIACQHYGKLRSPFGTDNTRKENDTPESVVAKLFASAKMSGTEFSQYGKPSHCLQNLPSEAQMGAMASEVQNLLVSGKKKEALQCAQEGQLWGPALVLASQLGDQFYVDTVKQMAIHQLVAGSPLRTLCLLIAGQPAEVFATDTSSSGHPGDFNMPLQSAQVGSNGMLDDWEENLAVITANQTKGDELVIIHLGDCLWKERSEITAAHICYLVAEANFESYSDSARLCLIGADHWKFPRTYASPEAIQRTELYEYSKVLGNSQFILHPFQPYKLIYAYMLAEVGKVSDSLKYCQAILKSLKTGRAPEVEMWKQLVLSLDERIRTHQQGGYAANLAPAKLVGKLLNFFDSTAHRVVGGLPPPAPLSSQGTVHASEQQYQQMAPRVSTSQSTMAMSTLVPSASSEWTADNNRMAKPNRSVSEPDIGRSPRQETTSPDAQGKAQVSGAASRFSRFGFGSQLFQKTVGLVLRPRAAGRQAKLGEKNKFYYDEKLKRWVEEGAELPAEEAALPPPPTIAAFQNGSNEYNLKSALKTEGSPPNEGSNIRNSSPELSPGMPPIPPSSNQFSARGRMSVRSRYVDTFNQGGGSSANLFQSPSVPAVKPVLAANAKFFIPAPAPSSNEQTMEAIAESNQEDSAANEDPSTSATNDWSFQSPKHVSSTAIQRFPSLGNMSKQGATGGSNSQFSHSRRAASWSGSFNDSFSPPKMGEIKPRGEALGMSPPSTYMPDQSSVMRTSTKSSSFGEDLQEVEL
ncbi:protein transport protein SEC16B homolog [Gastrolobium bilobum]|uniref:protein transport protein SEC16B homolog n=1 Tax=Gastrolobium bilobum TaxID=150636 RepID=UPI002AB05B1F|nr:protein transport protein SEC16B homolog [Gastrolobium bilobum]